MHRVVGIVLHVVYAVLCTPVCLVVTAFMCAFVSTLVVSFQSGVLDVGLMSLVVLGLASLSLCRELYVESLSGSVVFSSSLSGFVFFVLLFVSESILFGSVLSVEVLHLCCVSVSYCGSVSVYSSVLLLALVSWCGFVFSSAGGFLSTFLLSFSGCWAVYVVHSWVVFLLLCYGFGLGFVGLCSGVFVFGSCSDVLLLWFVLFSSAASLLWYVTTSLHGSHGLVGFVLLCGLSLCVLWYWLFSGAFGAATLLLCVLLYWHFVDLVWVFVFTFGFLSVLG